jgi:protein-disulfide isomerase
MTSGKQARRQRQQVARPPVRSTGGRKASPAVLIGALAVLVLVVAVAGVVLATRGGSSTSSSTPTKLADASVIERQFAGIPQSGNVLGKATAPATLVEYVDLQCPFCAQYATRVSPTIVKDYVRTGRVRIEQRTVRILGGQSADAARYAAAASAQDRMFQFSDLFFRNQGQENTGYVTQSFLERIGRSAGLRAGALTRAANSRAAGHEADAAERAFTDAGFSSTPSFTLGRTGGRQRPLNVEELTPGSFTGPIDGLLKGSG